MRRDAVLFEPLQQVGDELARPTAASPSARVRLADRRQVLAGERPAGPRAARAPWTGSGSRQRRRSCPTAAAMSATVTLSGRMQREQAHRGVDHRRAVCDGRCGGRSVTESALRVSDIVRRTGSGMNMEDTRLSPHRPRRTARLVAVSSSTRPSRCSPRQGFSDASIHDIAQRGRRRPDRRLLPLHRASPTSSRRRCVRVLGVDHQRRDRNPCRRGARAIPRRWPR